MARKKYTYVKSYRRRLPGRKRKTVLIRSYRFETYPTSTLKTLQTKQVDISKTGLRRHLTYTKKKFKRLKGKTVVDIKLKVKDSKGKINKDLVGIKGLVLSRRRANWQSDIGDYIHSQLSEYNLYFASYLSLKVAKRLKQKKARSVEVKLTFRKLK